MAGFVRFWKHSAEFVLDPGSEFRSKRPQWKAEVYVKLDLRIGDMDLAMQTCAVKAEGIAVPSAAQVILGCKLVGRFLHASLRTSDR